MYEIVQLNVGNEDFSKQLEEYSSNGWEVKCSYTERISKFIVNERVDFSTDWIILQKKK